MALLGNVWCDCVHTAKCAWYMVRTQAAMMFPKHQEQALPEAPRLHHTFHFELKCDIQGMVTQCLQKLKSLLSGNCWLHGEEKPLFIFGLSLHGLWRRRKLKGYMDFPAGKVP